MDRKRTREDADILIAQRTQKIEKADYCLENLDRSAAVIEIYVGEENRPYNFYMTTAELREFLNKEIGTQKAEIETLERYQNSLVFA